MTDFLEHVLFFNNCYIINKKNLLFLLVQMTPTLVVGSLGLFPLWISVHAFFGWLIWRSFAIVRPFPNPLQSWFSRAPSPVTTPVLGYGSLFQQRRPHWQQLHPFLVLHGRLCFETSFMQLIYVHSHRSYVPMNCIWSNDKLGNFLGFGSLVFHGFHFFLSLLEEKFCSPKKKIVLQFVVWYLWVPMLL